MPNYLNSFLNFFEFDGKSSLDFGVMVFSRGAYSDPEPNETEERIPGMNGVLHFWDGTFSDVSIQYSIMVKGETATEVMEKVEHMRSWLLSKRKYCKLRDTLHPDYFRMGIYKGKSNVEYSGNQKMGRLKIEFQCKPQMFLSDGEIPIVLNTHSCTLYNNTDFDAKPMIRVYGSGTITINEISVAVTEVSGYADIDCELQEVEGYNDKTTLQDGKFPVLSPGESQIDYTGFSKVEVTPRWWTL